MTVDHNASDLQTIENLQMENQRLREKLALVSLGLQTVYVGCDLLLESTNDVDEVPLGEDDNHCTDADFGGNGRDPS